MPACVKSGAVTQALTERLRRSLQQLEQDERRSFETNRAKGNDAA